MNSVKTVLSICAQNFRKWQTDYRVWCIAITLVAMISIYVDDFRKVNEIINTGVPVWIFPFLCTHFHTKLLYTLPIVLLFCNAPFTDKNQIFVFMRTSRVKWLCGQILYIVLASAVYYIFMILASVLLAGICGDFSSGWGETLYLVSENGSIIVGAKTFYLRIPLIILDFFSPLSAVWFTFLMSWLGGTFIGLIIFLCNLLSGKKLIDDLGLTDKLEGYSFYRLFDFVGAKEAWERALRR